MVLRLISCSPVIGLSCHRRLRNMWLVRTRSGRLAFRKLDAGVEASGPHDFAVRCNISRPLAGDRSQAHKNPPCNPVARKTLPRPPHSTPRFVTIMIRPSCGVGWRESVEMICPTGKSMNCGHIPLVSRTRCSVLPAMPTAARRRRSAQNRMPGAGGVERARSARPLVRRRTGHAVARLGQRCQGIRARRRAFFPGSGTWADRWGPAALFYGCA
jgi:hypothetical protein